MLSKLTIKGRTQTLCSGGADHSSRESNGTIDRVLALAGLLTPPKLPLITGEEEIAPDVVAAPVLDEPLVPRLLTATCKWPVISNRMPWRLLEIIKLAGRLGIAGIYAA